MCRWSPGEAPGLRFRPLKARITRRKTPSTLRRERRDSQERDSVARLAPDKVRVVNRTPTNQPAARASQGRPRVRIPALMNPPEAISSYEYVSIPKAGKIRQ